MSRPSAWPPRIYHHARSGRDRIRIRGKDYYLGPTGSAAARAEYARLISELTLNRGLPPRPAGGESITVTELVARWWTDAGGRLSKKGREPDQFRATLRPLLRLYGASPANDFDAERLEALRVAMASGSWMTDEEKLKNRERKRSIGLSRNVLNRRIVRIRTVWRWAERRRLVPVGSWGNLRTLAAVPSNDPTVRQTSPARAAAPFELESVLPFCRPTVGAMLRLQSLTGMRPAEVRLMRTIDVDRSDPACWVYRPGSGAGPCGEHKNAWRGQTRAVTLGPASIAIVQPWLNESNPGAFLFEASTGKPYTDFSYPQAVRRACVRAGVKFSPYSLRHAAKQRITRELGLDAARAVLGQKSLDSTNGYADAVDLKIAADAAKQLS